MSDTIELAVVQVCDEVILALQMFTALAFGLTCLLMYGTLHRWFGSDVAKELANDEEQSLFSKLTSESMLEARSKFGAVEKKKTEAEKKKEKDEKKLKKKKKAGQRSASASASLGVSSDETNEQPPHSSPTPREAEAPTDEALTELAERDQGERGDEDEDVLADENDGPPPGAEIELVDVMNDDGLVVENRDTGRDDVDEEWLEDENIEVGDDGAENAAAADDDERRNPSVHLEAEPNDGRRGRNPAPRAVAIACNEPKTRATPRCRRKIKGNPASTDGA
jgi:hypothetical protein